MALTVVMASKGSRTRLPSLAANCHQSVSAIAESGSGDRFADQTATVIPAHALLELPMVLTYTAVKALVQAASHDQERVRNDPLFFVA
ncbi:MAG: hypothetical protein MUC44_04970 [Beijerinckiaceae bacterium]|jgi:hypothetical protein|nr:hypothetical protein [Beijerinckiaceae bacterium]